MFQRIIDGLLSIDKKAAILSLIIAIFVHMYVRSTTEGQVNMQNDANALYLMKQGDYSHEQTNSSRPKKADRRNHRGRPELDTSQRRTV